jgi:replicative DNA helicase
VVSVKELVVSWYSRVPPHERDKPVLILDGRLYTPSDIYREVVAGTPLGEKLQRVLESVRLSTSLQTLVYQLWEVGKARALKWVEDLPPNFSMVTIGGEVIDKNRLRQLIEAGTGIGAKAIEAEARMAVQLLKM